MARSRRYTGRCPLTLMTAEDSSAALRKNSPESTTMRLSSRENEPARSADPVEDGQGGARRSAGREAGSCQPAAVSQAAEEEAKAKSGQDNNQSHSGRCSPRRKGDRRKTKGTKKRFHVNSRMEEGLGG